MKIHFIVECPFYNDLRVIFFHTINSSCPNFQNLSLDHKFFWLFTNENMSILTGLRNFIMDAMHKRQSGKR